MVFVRKYHHKHDKKLQTASLDRTDSFKGYSYDNVLWTHKTVNKMKNTFTRDRFRELCSLVCFPLTGLVGQMDEMSSKKRGHYKNISNGFWYSVKNNAKVRGLEVTVDLAYLWDLFISQRGCCSITGLPLEFSDVYWGFWNFREKL